jgi:hypothetical protein
LIIFNLDRFIVSTFRKIEKGNFWERLWRELLQASPRIVLSIIIAIIISKPIEIKIFESRLAEQIQRNGIEAKKGNIDDFSSIYGLAVKEGRITGLDSLITKMQTELTTDPQNVKDLINNELAQANSALERINNTNNPKIENCRRNITTIRNNSSNYRPILDKEGNFIENRLTKEANDKIRTENRNISELQRQIKEQQLEVTKIDKRIEEERKLYREQKTQEITERKQEKDSAQVQLKTATATAEQEAEEANKISEKAFSNNFITQIEALGDLTDNDTTMWWTSLMITLLFLTIELAPILTKLITKRGPYDETLERIEYEKMIEQKEIISHKNTEINALLEQAEEAAKLKAETKFKIEKDKLNAELKTNKAILDDLVKKQEYLALMALEKWFEAEKAKQGY